MDRFIMEQKGEKNESNTNRCKNPRGKRGRT